MMTTLIGLAIVGAGLALIRHLDLRRIARHHDATAYLRAARREEDEG